MLDFRSTDTERQSAERAMGGRMRITADDGHSRLGQSHLRPDDVNDTLLGRVDIVKSHSEFRAVLGERFHLLARDIIDNRQAAVGCRDIVVHGRDGSLRTTYLTTG